MFEDSIKLLNDKGVLFTKGLSNDEFRTIESIYNIIFPQSLKSFLMEKMPVSKGFYNWRDMSEDNILYLKNVINMPFDNIYNMADDVYWCDDWGDEPCDKTVFINKVREQLKKAPKLLPIYSHRYIPITSDNNPPVLSVHAADIIYYGVDIEDYFNIEFGEKKQKDIQFETIKHIEFWSDIM